MTSALPIQPFEPSLFSGAEGLTFPAYRELLARAGRDPEIVALAARSGEVPVGLVLARGGAQRWAGVLSLYVRPEFRRAGLGTRLLAAVENPLQVPEREGVLATYSSQAAGTPAFERVLAKCGWGTPQPGMLLVQTGREIMEAPWFRRPLPAGVELFPWVDLTKADRTALEDLPAYRHLATLEGLEAGNRVPEPCNSLGIRCDGQAAGWLLTHRLGPKLVRYSRFFVREEYRRRVQAFAVLAEAVRRQHDALGSDSVGTFGILSENHYMIRLFHRKLRPWVRSWSETRRSWKPLRAGAAAAPGLPD